MKIKLRQLMKVTKCPQLKSNNTIREWRWPRSNSNSNRGRVRQLMRKRVNWSHMCMRKWRKRAASALIHSLYRSILRDPYWCTDANSILEFGCVWRMSRICCSLRRGIWERVALIILLISKILMMLLFTLQITLYKRIQQAMGNLKMATSYRSPSFRSI